jgi:hypothetical protein
MILKQDFLVVNDAVPRCFGVKQCLNEIFLLKQCQNETSQTQIIEKMSHIVSFH